MASTVGIATTQSDLLDRDEAAAYLGISASTLAMWACTGRVRLKLVRVGRRVKYRKSDLDAFLEANTTTPEEKN